MFRWIRSCLSAGALRKARKARADQLARYAAAKKRGDTRAQHDAARAAREATTAVVRLELCR